MPRPIPAKLNEYPTDLLEQLRDTLRALYPKPSIDSCDQLSSELERNKHAERLGAWQVVRDIEAAIARQERDKDT